MDLNVKSFFEIHFHFQNKEVCLFVLYYYKFIDFNEVRNNFTVLNITLIYVQYFTTVYM